MSDTPETKRALDYIYDRDGELWERNAPEKLVTLCRKLEREWQYRYNEALSLGRTEKQARIEADEWRNKIEHEQEKPNRTEGMPTLRN